MKAEVEQVVSIDKNTLAKYLNEKIGNDIFEAVNSLSQFEIPGHILIVLLLICMYSRDGVLMEKQVGHSMIYFIKTYRFIYYRIKLMLLVITTSSFYYAT